ncbi:MAG TPA: hypothetical protein VMD51_11185, partial [Mycobacterium sp.]|nr:hypothetical protein [Mycobacterium sp.]
MAGAQTAVWVKGLTPVLRTPAGEYAWHLTELGGRYANDDMLSVDYPASAWPQVHGQGPARAEDVPTRRPFANTQLRVGAEATPTSVSANGGWRALRAGGPSRSRVRCGRPT